LSLDRKCFSRRQFLLSSATTDKWPLVRAWFPCTAYMDELLPQVFVADLFVPTSSNFER